MAHMIQTLKSLHLEVRLLKHGTHLQTECGQERHHLSILVLRTGQTIYLTTCSWNMIQSLQNKLEDYIKCIQSHLRRCSRFLMQT
nr:MAG TPA: hypothetical protein [Caudoviricetes sp.]